MRTTWPSVPLAEVLAERQEVPDPNALTSGAIRIVSKIGFNDGLIQLRTGVETKTGMILIRPGDLVLSGINAAKGAIAIYGEEKHQPIAATIHYGAYIPRKDLVDLRYLWWLLRSGTFRDLLGKYVPGGIKTELKAKRFLPIPVPLPSLEEQRRIVARIEQLAAKIEEARRLRYRAVQEVEALTTSVLQQVFKHLRQEYGTRQIGDFADVKGGKRLPAGERLSDEPNEFPYIRVADMKDHSVDMSGLKYVPARLHHGIARYTISANDVYITIAGTIGYPGTIPEELDGANLTENAAKIVFGAPDSINKHYVVYALCSPQVQEQFSRRQTVAAQPKLALHRISSTGIPLPPLAEQQRIVAYLDGLAGKVAALARLQAETATKLDALLPSILDKAFKGEL